MLDASMSLQARRPSRAGGPGQQGELPSLVRLLLDRLDRVWHGAEVRPARDRRVVGFTADERRLEVAKFVTRGYLRSRTPDEIEAVLATLDAGAMDLIRQTFEFQALGLNQFAEAIVRTGAYDAERIVAFVGGVVDLFLEILRTQGERAQSGQPRGTVNWPQVMNHFIECPEIAMFEGSEGGILGTKVASSTSKAPQVARNNFVDRAKHQCTGIERLYWFPYVDSMVTVEGNESISFFSPHAPGSDAARATLVPQLGPDFYDEGDRALFTVLAVAWDEELQDLVALLNNRMLIVWRLRNRERCQWQQKRELQFHATRHETKGLDKAPTWRVKLLTIDPQTGADINAKKKADPDNEAAMRREKNEMRQAEEASAQHNIWWNPHLKCWFTADRNGKLYVWDLRVMEGAWLEPWVEPKKVLTEHTKLVTSHLELNKNKFTTTSLDRTVILWDLRNLTPEMRIEGAGAHTASVLSQAYLPRFNILVTVGCEKKVFCWTIDSTAYRGMKGKLSGHQANLLQVSAGQRLFFTLDETHYGILWDGATLACLQTVACTTIIPRHCACLPEHGTICLAGRRLNFVEGNEVAAEKLGKPLTKEQQASALNKQKEGASLKESAPPKYCGLSSNRGCMLSATEVEVRLHARGCPGNSRALFNAPEGETISTFAASDKLSWAVLGTSKGAIHFLKYRSGFALKVYPGRPEGLEEWQGASAPAAAAGGADGPAGVGEAADRTQKGARGRAGPVGEPGRSPSPSAGAPRSPQAAAGKAGGALPSASPTGALPATPGMLSATAAISAVMNEGAIGGEDDGPAPAAPSSNRAARAPGALAAAAGGPAGGGAGAGAAEAEIRNAPTPEEIQRGLSRCITCVLPCEEHRRIFVGTAEGRVLVFASEEGFPIIRWLHSPEDNSAVTCLNCGATEEAGLLVVGTQEGVVHLYSLDNLRVAGSINVPRLLCDTEASFQGTALRHARLFAVRSEPELPLTLLTIDAASRFRLWGLEIQEQSGKMKELKLLMDGGQLRESDCVPARSRPTPARASASSSTAAAVASPAAAASASATAPPPPTGSRVGWKAVKGKAGKDGEPEKASAASGAKAGADASAPTPAAQAAASGSKGAVVRESEGAVTFVIERARSQELVKVSAVTLVGGLVTLPTRALARQPRDGPTRAADKPPIHPKKAAQIGAKADPKRAEKEQAALASSQLSSTSAVFLTGVATGGAATGRPTTPAGPDSEPVPAVVLEGVEVEGLKPPEFSASDTDGEEDEVVGRRFHERPATPKPPPPLPSGASDADRAAMAAAYEPVLADGSRILFLADTGGWIWCVDVAATVSTALARGTAVAVLMDHAVRAATAKRQGLRVSIRNPASTAGSQGLFGSRGLDDLGPVLAKPLQTIRPQPDAIQIVGAWPAHLAAITSLVPVTAPSALVSTDVEKEVKVWSTAGDLWAHFSLRGVDGARPPVAVWPPPHVLATQVALMRTAKVLCRRMGFHTQKADELAMIEVKQKQMRKAQNHRHARMLAQEQAKALSSAVLSPARSSLLSTSTLRPEPLRERMGSGLTHCSSMEPNEEDRESEAGTQLMSRSVSKHRGSDMTISFPGGATFARNISLEEEPAPAVDDEEDPLPVEGANSGNNSQDEGGASGRGSKERGDDEATEGGAGRKKKQFTSAQLSEMVRNHAFSSGYQTYKQFIRKVDPAKTEHSWRTRGEPLAQLEAQRARFFTREASAFGIELRSDKEAASWEATVKTIGHRSASEGALLRYAHGAVEDLTRSVKESLGVDVSRVTRRQIRKPSFAQKLDIGGVSANPSDPASATGQAVRKLYRAGTATESNISTGSLPPVNLERSAAFGLGPGPPGRPGLAVRSSSSAALPRPTAA